MTGFTSLPIAEEGNDDQQQQFKGVARILGPRWAQFPTITIGLLGVQIFWSVEMSYGALFSFVDLEACLTLGKSLAVSVVARIVQVKHGCRVCSRTTFWPHNATTNRGVGRQLHISVWAKKTIHDAGNHNLRCCHAATWIYTSSCLHFYWMG